MKSVPSRNLRPPIPFATTNGSWSSASLPFLHRLPRCHQSKAYSPKGVRLAASNALPIECLAPLLPPLLRLSAAASNLPFVSAAQFCSDFGRLFLATSFLAAILG